MIFFQHVLASFRHLLPVFLMSQLLLIPFVALEQWRPAGPRPRVGDYALNVLIAFTTLALTLPVGMAAGIGGALARTALHLRPLGFSLHALGSIPAVGGVVEIAAVVVASLFLHDLWFYWAHRLEHATPFLWEFHKLHHSDERMNATTWARDHFLQVVWRQVFPTFTVGLVLDLDVRKAGAAGLYVGLVTSLLSMFYHSGVRLRAPWLDRIVVTPQVHRLHHSVDPAHHNRNFADFLPIFDIVFGTYRQPGPDEFPSTGLGDEYAAPRGILAAQLRPVAGAAMVVMRAIRGGGRPVQRGVSQ
jgi:sterol desaturase/sphingolipid hydroxylase (fatty acid hydroxylase superfamily)